MNYHNLRRFLITESDGEILISGQDFLHLKNVMRIKIGDRIIGIKNDGYDYLCQITDLKKDSALCQLLEKRKNSSEPSFTLDIFQALLKGEKMELIAQKCTELGACNFIPFTSEFCQVKATSSRVDRLQKISQESAKQCKRSNYLNISPILSFDDMIANLSDYNLIIFAYELEENNYLTENILSNCKKVAIIIGSEGGFSEKEAEKLQKLGAKSISLGKRILRAETATIHLCGLVSHYLEGHK